MRPIRTSQFTLAQRRLVATVLLRKGAASLSASCRVGAASCRQLGVDFGGHWDLDTGACDCESECVY